MGGTGPDSVPLGFADPVFFSDGQGNAITPPANTIYNPGPATQHAQPLYIPQAVVQLLRPYTTWQPGHSQLPYQACDPGHYVTPSISTRRGRPKVRRPVAAIF